ncbi:D-alanyl-D-alanine carboxypeptidase family protein [Hydrogenoanaerobacterium sp.]|uniref:D-alanyl-D-alanine carboxypeptidase family protein n=1 Tax=Hydrogenoanaerobacterium sp. TaxID=2953763 RepID=UPI00289CF468|nr:D-alanyl-D-alanine carboxypeptidase family protein [Hydrogenoanaerobacterium sp.]
MRKLSFSLALLMTVIFCTAAFSVSAAYTPPFDITAEAAYLVNLNTGDVIYEKNADKKMYPASLTKLMTCILAFELVDDLDNTTVTAKAYIYDEFYGKNVSTGDIRRGEIMTMRQLIYAMLMQSANEAASIVADYLGDGSIAYFTEMMTERAKELGCTGTNFTNPHGLFDENNYTTAKDMYLIAKHAIGIPGFLEIASTTHYQVGSTNIHDSLAWNTTNKMMVKGTQYYYAPVKGLKTGTLDESGKCFVSTASLNGFDYLCVVLGAPLMDDENGREIGNNAFTDTKQLYQWAFDTFSIKTLMEKGSDITEIPLRLAKNTDHMKLESSERFTSLVPDEIEPSSVVLEYDLPEHITAPVKKGDEVGKVRLILAGEQIGEVPLVATSSAERSQVLYVLDQAENIVLSFWFKFGVIFLVAFVLFYIVLMVIRNRNLRRSRSTRPRR